MDDRRRCYVCRSKCYKCLQEVVILKNKFQINNLETFNLKTAVTTVIQYPKPLYQDYSLSQKPPFTFLLTEFHVLLAYVDTIKGVSLLNKELIYEDNYNEAFGKLVDVIKDPMTGTYFAILIQLTLDLQSI